MKEQIVFLGKEFEEYYQRVSKAWIDFIKAAQDAPKHARVHVEFLREHGRSSNRKFDISIKYPLVGDSDNFREVTDPLKVSETE